MRWLMNACRALFIWWAACGLAWAAELKIELDDGERVYSTTALLARPDLRELDVPDDVAYVRDMRFKAVPMAALLQGVPPETNLQIVALDGFAAEAAVAPMLNADPARATAWLAVEDPAQPWPGLPGNRPSAGPFYLIWNNPAASGIKPEQWPYQIARIRQLAPAAERFPAMRPAVSEPAGSRVRHGFEVFQAQCMVCHTFNYQGDARMGPDLNVPFSPVEYMQREFLVRYIRNPRALRHWPDARMPPFSEQALPPEDLDALLAYLSHMAGRKAQPPASQPAKP